MVTNSWEAVFRHYASQTGFSSAPLPTLTGAPVLPPKATLWRSTYAQILTIEFNLPTPDILQGHAKVGQEWLDVSSMALERNDHTVMDAYLLLVSLAALPREMLYVVRDIELDPTSCRKHVAWPLPGDSDDIVWRRLLRVTVLGLPISPQASGMTNTPTLNSDFEIRLLEDVKNLKGRPAARRHVESSEPEDST